jgi:formate/nitrite transporter FocA (FNT family)
MTATAPGTPAAPHPRLRATLQRSIDEGQVRLERTWPSLITTGLVGGADLGVGVLVMLVVTAKTGEPLLGALAFTIGFVALTLAQSELFTENFLVPVTTVVARDATVGALIRLWVVTLVANLVAGWGITGLVLSALPEVRATAIEIGRHYPEWGIGWSSFAAGVLGGAVITLMTWMERGTDSVLGKLVAAVTMAFVLAAPPLDHAIVSSFEMFAALHAGAPFGYADWAGATAWAVLANMVGGLGFVTMLRLVQVGRGALEEEQRREPNEPRETEQNVDAL